MRRYAHYFINHMFQQLPDVYPVRINLMNIGVNKYTA